MAEEHPVGHAWPSGEKLPSERELAQQFGVGRPLIREALRSLAEMGLIETIPARGTFVRAVDDPASHRQAGIAIRRRGVTAHELSEARLLLETSTARYAAERATDEDIARLETSWSEWTRARACSTSRDDLAFHLEVAAAAHNPVVEMMLESIAVPTAALMLRSVGDPDVMRPQPALPPRLRSTPSSGATPTRPPRQMRAHLTVAQDLYGDGLRAQRRRAGTPGAGPARRARRASTTWSIGCCPLARPSRRG